ncbi:MerR family transcriptional regulator [Gorillibacterium sp. sgz500922]|uniref:MerR family transcriptional regulator n=1 Tax=Gorillibacterium sp. sgz500922 TaxID=3446694 RepID=UPI003F66C487
MNDKRTYTVKEVTEFAPVTVKALHHYDRIGLLVPGARSEAGYRLYGRAELERLQQILFYRELDFPLEEIKELLASEPDRRDILTGQRELLRERMERLERIAAVLDRSLEAIEQGISEPEDVLFQGFESEEAWRHALAEQREHLLAAYGFDLAEEPVVPEEMNEQAREAQSFLQGMAEALRDGRGPAEEATFVRVREHLAFLARQGHPARPQDFAAQTAFFLRDDFHRGMLESQQTGLAYYLRAVAEAYAEQAAEVEGSSGES